MLREEARRGVVAGDPGPPPAPQPAGRKYRGKVFSNYPPGPATGVDAAAAAATLGGGRGAVLKQVLQGDLMEVCESTARV